MFYSRALLPLLTLNTAGVQCAVFSNKADLAIRN